MLVKNGDCVRKLAIYALHAVTIRSKTEGHVENMNDAVICFSALRTNTLSGAKHQLSEMPVTACWTLLLANRPLLYHVISLNTRITNLLHSAISPVMSTHASIY